MSADGLNMTVHVEKPFETGVDSSGSFLLGLGVGVATGTLLAMDDDFQELVGQAREDGLIKWEDLEPFDLWYQ